MSSHDDDCFYYHSWRNNVVIAFGTLSSLVWWQILYQLCLLMASCVVSFGTDAYRTLYIGHYRWRLCNAIYVEQSSSFYQDMSYTVIVVEKICSILFESV